MFLSHDNYNNPENNDCYQTGFHDGFENAQNEIRKELKEAYKKSKKQGLLFAKILKKIKIRDNSMFTCTDTASNHQCNCEFCELSKK